MHSIHQRYSELVSLTQIYLLGEYSLNETKFIDPSLFSYFYSNNKEKSLPVKTEPKKQPPVSIPKKADPVEKVEILQPIPLNEKPEIQKKPIEKSVIPHAIQESVLDKVRHPLEPLKSPPPIDFSEIRKTCQNLFPGWKLLENTIPYLANFQGLILSFHPDELPFLKNLEKALSLRIGQTKIVSALDVQGWKHLLNAPSLRFIIANSAQVQSTAALVPFFRKNTEEDSIYLGKTPLIELLNPSTYMNQPQLKGSLWRAICNELSLVRS